jgi:hypothetical protein
MEVHIRQPHGHFGWNLQRAVILRLWKGSSGDSSYIEERSSCCVVVDQNVVYGNTLS